MLCPFTKFLQEEDIIAQFIMLDTPQLNGVALIDMVRSMINNSSFALNLQSEALNINVYILNRAPSKVVPKTPFEL